MEQKLLVFRQRGAHKWVPKKEIRSDDSKGETEFQTLHSPCVCFQSSEPSVAMKESVGPLNPLRKVMLASQPYEAVRTWSTQMTLNENAEPTAIPPQQLPFPETSGPTEDWHEKWEQFQRDFATGADLDFGIFARTDAPTGNFFYQEKFFAEYVREQVASLPVLNTEREVLTRDKKGQVIAAKIAQCDRVAGAPPKPLREMCFPAKNFARKLGSEVEDYVFPPTAKGDALESLKHQLELIDRTNNWKNLVNDRKSHFATTIADFSEKMARTVDGAPLPNFMESRAGFKRLFEDVVEGFDKTKSTGFESRIRSGPKDVWMEDPTALAHLYYRVVCKMVLMITLSNELSTATPEEMIFTYLVRDPTEVFIKDEAHAKKKRDKRKWRLIWSLSFSDNVLCKLIWGFTSKNAITRFQFGEDGEIHTGIGVGHHNEGIDNLFNKICALCKGRGSVSTDDASNWDLSTTRDGFVFGAMIAFRSAAGGIQDTDKANAFHRLMYSFTLAHTAHVVIFGITVVSIFSYGLMPSGIWYTGLLNSIMRSLGVIFERFGRRHIGWR